MSSIKHDANDHDQRIKASKALIQLQTDLRGNGTPDYSDSYIVAAYLVRYHLSHCALAYFSFKAMFSQFDVPNTIYVCDVGAGTGAARVGLALALREFNATPTVYFDAFEPSALMRSAGNSFWKYFKDYLKSALPFNYRESGRIPNDVPKLPQDTCKLTTAFHLSLPYSDDSYGFLLQPQNSQYHSAHESVAKVDNLVCPDLAIYTCHPEKADTLRHILGSDSSSYTKENLPNTGPGVETTSSFYTDCAATLGFEVNSGSSVTTWSRHRFSLPDSVLLWRERSEEERQRERPKRIEPERRRQQLSEWVPQQKKADEFRRKHPDEARRQRLWDQRKLEEAKAEEDRRRQEALDELWASLRAMVGTDQVISAEIVGHTNVGLLVDWRGFTGSVPYSHCRDIATRESAELSKLYGRVFDFNVLAVDYVKVKFKLTRTAIIEEKCRESIKEIWNSFYEGQVLAGKVVNIREFGAFVRVADGVEGLVHISELTRHRPTSVTEVVSLEQEVEVKVIGVDVEKNRLSLSIRETMPDPWENVESVLKKGDKRKGEVKNIRDFGLFVQLEDGLDGLVHVSKFGSKNVADFRVGDVVSVEILDIDTQRRRIPLRLLFEDS